MSQDEAATGAFVKYVPGQVSSPESTPPRGRVKSPVDPQLGDWLVRSNFDVYLPQLRLRADLTSMRDLPHIEMVDLEAISCMSPRERVRFIQARDDSIAAGVIPADTENNGYGTFTAAPAEAVESDALIEIPASPSGVGAASGELATTGDQAGDFSVCGEVIAIFRLSIPIALGKLSRKVAMSNGSMFLGQLGSHYMTAVIMATTMTSLGNEFMFGVCMPLGSLTSQVRAAAFH